MIKIESVNMKYARNGDHVKFIEDVLVYLTEEFAKTHKIEKLYQILVLLYGEEKAAYIKQRVSATTEQIKEAHRVRIDIFIFMMQIITANRKCPTTAARNAARELEAVCRGYRNAPELTYSECSAAITHLLEDLFKEENVAHLETLDLGASAEQLTSANDAFNALYLDRTNEAERIRSLAKMKEIRPKVDEAYRNCVETVNALQQINEMITEDATVKASLDEFILRINGLIHQLQKNIASHRTGGTDEEEEGEEVVPDEADPAPEA